MAFFEIEQCARSDGDNKTVWRFKIHAASIRHDVSGRETTARMAAIGQNRMFEYLG
jgi:hypothetical protein